jgi:D-alanyl-D-alanine carboxypeptidase
MQARLSWLILALLVSACGARGAVRESSSARPATATDAAIEQILQRVAAAGTFSGVVLVTRGGRTVHASARGLADRAAGVAHRLDEPFRYASITKQVTALLVMQEVAAGRIELDRSVSTYLPTLAPTFAPITVRDLLRHTAGLPNLDGDDEVALPPAYAARPAAALLAVIEGPCQPKTTAITGSFSYNNCDYRVLEALLERMSGTSYGALVSERIAKPLGLASWALYPPDGRDPTPVRGVLEDGSVEPAYNLANFGGAGALYGTASDLARWGRAMLDHELLDPASTALMFKGDQALSMEALGSWSYELEFAGAVPATPVKIIERQGSIGGVRTALFLSPSHDVVVVVLSNTAATRLEGLWSGTGLSYDLLAAAVVR